MHNASSQVANDSSPRTRDALDRLLHAVIEHPERKVEVTATIDNVFGQDRAVLVLDMSGFSRTTQRHGIVSFLLMIHQLKILALPAIEAHNGQVIKSEADNLFCLFRDTMSAVEASLELMKRLELVNLLLAEDRRLYASIGIGYGRILNVKDHDLFGDEVNLASKLGEDIAEKEAILLTSAARAQLEGQEIAVRDEQLSISGMTLCYHVVCR